MGSMIGEIPSTFDDRHTPFLETALPDAITGTPCACAPEHAACVNLQPCPRGWVDRRLLDASDTGIFHISSSGRLLDANDTLASMLGYASPQALRLATERDGLDAWTYARERRRALVALYRGRDGAAGECRLRRLDGTELRAVLHLHVLCGPEGNACSLVGAVEDISARSAAERKLRDSEQRYRASFEQAALGILHTSLKGRILECNGRFAEIVGYSPEELVGRSFQDITPPEDRTTGQAAAESLLRVPKPVSFEKRYLRKDGSLTWVLLTISVQRDSDGNPLNFLTLVQDINDRKDAEAKLAHALEALRISEERYRAAFQMSLDAINLNRLQDGMYVDCNQAFLGITGFVREEVIGRTSLELNVWADAGDRQRLVEQLKRDGVCRDLEAQFRKKNGSEFCGLMSASLLELNGEVCILSMTRDISQAKAADEEIRNLAFYDPLTGLPNRRLLLERLEDSLRSRRPDAHMRALLFVDLDNFKTLNDTLGHQAGDLLLQEVARRLAGCVRPGDMAARLGGDEFVVVLENLSEAPEAAAAQTRSVAERILEVAAQPYMLDDRECVGSASIGITIFDSSHRGTAELLQQADIALYQAKSAGRNTARFFAPALQAAVNARAILENELRQGIRARQFVLFYQPQVSHGQLIGAEALLRWNHPRRGILPPSEFIALAEETDLIIPLGIQALEQACAQMAKWEQEQPSTEITVAVNVSARQFRQPDFVQTVLSTLEKTRANPRLLKLEITESMLLDNIEQTIAIMERLKREGIRFSLDDFGTGYSSLAYLKRLPLDQLKIDRVFVRDMLDDPTCTAIARTIISLSGLMGLSLVAEGVETEEQRSQLDAFGCHAFQGYLFSPPIPPAQFQELMKNLPAD